MSHQPPGILVQGKIKRALLQKADLSLTENHDGAISAMGGASGTTPTQICEQDQGGVVGGFKNRSSILSQNGTSVPLAHPELSNTLNSVKLTGPLKLTCVSLTNQTVDKPTYIVYMIILYIYSNINI